jgi:hypothetical protein
MRKFLQTFRVTHYAILLHHSHVHDNHENSEECAIIIFKTSIKFWHCYTITFWYFNNLSLKYDKPIYYPFNLAVSIKLNYTLKKFFYKHV